jgi:phytoene dehydrogenase-like protein
MDRRRFLVGSLASAGLTAAGLGVTARLARPDLGRRDPPPAGEAPGEHASDALPGLGHRWRDPFERPETPPATADVVIVGAGVAGLCAAWRLAGTGLRVRLLELWRAPGGTALAGTGARGAYPWGAHYVTLPGPDAAHMRRLLRELGVITGFDSEDQPFYAPDALCLAPEERIWDAGTWVEGLWPVAHATPEDRAQRALWDEVVRDWSARIGADGRPAFTIPIAKCSIDPAIRALADIRFSDWLDTAGFTAPVLRWWLAYATRDDYGAALEETSAWAGLHYFCSRRPAAADARDLGTHVLTWPAGNGHLVDGLVMRAGTTPETGAIVRAVEPDASRVRVWIESATSGTLSSIDAAQVILAVPTRLAQRLLGRGVEGLPDHAPWRVAQLQVSRPPAARGVPTAWDSVIYGASSLGYVNSSHQTGRYGGPAVLTWYEPLTGDPAAGRRALLGEDWGSARDRVIDDLAPSHPDLLDVLERVDIWHWGHGTTIPAVGLHGLEGDRPRLESLTAPHPRVQLAHTDLSGISLFEEASHHGLRAAEAVLASFGRTVETWL